MTPLRRMRFEAGVVEADGLLVVLDEGVHDGPPDQGWASPPMIPGSAFIWGFQGARPLALVLQRQVVPD